MTQKMSQVEKWCEGKPLILTSSATMTVSAADECQELIELARSGQPLPGFGRKPGASEWLLLYREHRRVRRVAFAAFFPAGALGFQASDLDEVQDGLLEYSRHPERLQSELAKMTLEELQEAWQQGKAMAQEFNIAANAIDDLGGLDPAMMASVEVLYFLTVWMPCWLEYGEHPANLLRIGPIPFNSSELSATAGIVAGTTRGLLHRRAAPGHAGQGPA